MSFMQIELSHPEQYTLLVMDNDPNSLPLMNYLREFGFTLLMAKDGFIALAESHQPDLILLDLGGFETCQRLKAHEATCHIPVIFMALTHEADKVKAFEVGAADYMTTPIIPRELLARVTTQIRLMASRREQEYQRKIIESLRKVALILNSSLNQKQLLHIIMEQLRHVVPFDGGAIFLQETTQLILSQALGFGETYIGQMLPVTDNSSVLQVLQRQKPMLITDTQYDERWQKWHDADRIASWMGVPLVIESESIGVITVDSFTTQKYTEADLAVLQIFAHHATVAIRNTRLSRWVQGTNHLWVKSVTA